MYNNINNKAKLNVFKPVRIPKVRDVFKRMGYRNIPTSSSSPAGDYSRNPLEIHDGFSRGFQQHLYDDYAKMMSEQESSSIEESSVSEENGVAVNTQNV